MSWGGDDTMAALLGKVGKKGGKDKGGKGKGGKGKGGKGGKGGGGKFMSKSQQRLSNGEQVYSGTLRSYNTEKMSGFIHCTDVLNECGTEVYAFSNVLAESFVGVGDEVAFFLHWSAKGQPQASSPTIRLSSNDDTKLVHKGHFKAAKEEDKTYGFVECWETKQFWGRDVYVAANLAEGLVPGMPVAFNLYLNRDGMPNAKAVAPCEEHYQPPPGDLSETAEAFPKGGGKGGKGGKDDAMMGMMAMMMGMDPWSMGMGKGKGGKGKGKSGPYGGGGGGGGKKPEGTGQFLSGTVKSFNSGNNYGFIASEDVKAQYGSDVFCGGSDLANFSVGQAVLFQLALNDQGKPQAIDVSAIS